MPAEMRRPLYALVLAGGESRRMGRDKALLKRGGQTQLAYVYSLVDSFAERAFVSSRESQRGDPERSRFPQVVDRYAGIGPVAGILTAMEDYPDADWLVVACDLPNVDSTALEFLLANRSATQPFTAFTSSYDGLPEPLCAVYGAGSADLVRKFIGEGVDCPRKMMIRSDTRLLQQPDPRALDNVNTPDDLAESVLEGHA